MDDNVLKLFSSLSSAVEAVRPHDYVHIFSHHDADGISAGIILAKTMVRAGKGFTLTLLSGLNKDSVKEILNCGAKCVMIADMGVSYLKELDGMDADVVVLDHHAGGSYEPSRVRYANPHSFGIDGMSEGCGASVSLLFSVKYDENNWDLVKIAFAGIIGDKQHQKGLSGINGYLFGEGNRRGHITGAGGSLIPSGRLMSSLFLSVDPYIRGVSGDADGVGILLKDAGIDMTASSDGLTEQERRRLSSLIAAKLLKQGVTKETLDDRISARYILKNWEMDAEMISSVLDSCGRSGNGSIGIGFGLGDKKCHADAVKIDEDARKDVVLAVKELDSRGLERMGNIMAFDNSSSGFTGILCDIAMRYIGGMDMPVIGYNKKDDITKVSGRCPRSLLAKGVNLTTAMREAGIAAGGEGGGHSVAAGASFPAGNERMFLETLDRIIGEQISAR